MYGLLAKKEENVHRREVAVSGGSTVLLALITVFCNWNAILGNIVQRTLLVKMK